GPGWWPSAGAGLLDEERQVLPPLVEGGIVGVLAGGEAQQVAFAERPVDPRRTIPAGLGDAGDAATRDRTTADRPGRHRRRSAAALAIRDGVPITDMRDGGRGFLS